MRNALLLLLAAMLFSNGYSQNKPPLPGDYFDNYSYTLQVIPYDVATDSADFESEIRKLAISFFQFTDSTINYQCDTNELYYIAAYKMAAAIALGEPPPALEYISIARKLKPAPPYRTPLGFFQEAYANALLQFQATQSEFISTLRQTVKAAYANLDPAFRSDLINAHKGLFNAGSVEVNRTVLQNIIDQAAKETDGKLNFSSAYDLIDAWFQFRFRKVFQKEVETALYELSPARVQQSEAMIPMRDGIHLSGWIYRNVIDTSKVPAVVSLSPYPSGFEATRGNVFATNGYIYVYVDSRGRRKSEGEFFPYENDAQDYYDIIDWVSKQPWCNGQVATSGGSYLGFAQWQAIRKKYRHPALKAINPMVSVGFGVDFPRLSQQFYSYILQWAVYVSGKDLNNARFNDNKFWNKVNYDLYKNRIPFAKLDSVAGLPNPFFQKWVSHPDFDSYWTSILPNEEDYTTLDIPVLSITGYYDGDQLGAFYYYNNHLKYAGKSATDKHFLLIGPYDHGGSQWQPSPIQNGISIEKEAQIPIYKYVIWWYDWVLKGKQRPAFLKDKVNYFVTGTGEWKSTPSLKNITTDTLNLYLSADKWVKDPKWDDKHALSTTRQAIRGKSVTYTHDISTVIDSARLFATQRPFDDSLYMTSPYNLVFESEPLEKDIIVTGKMTAQIWLTLNVPDADFSMSIYEVTPDNKSYNISNAILRSRYRNGGEKPALVKPGEMTLLSFNDVFLYIKKIPKGNRIRFVFESTNTPYGEKNYGFGGVVSKETTDRPRIIEAKILTSPVYPSRIVIPYANP